MVLLCCVLIDLVVRGMFYRFVYRICFACTVTDSLIGFAYNMPVLAYIIYAYPACFMNDTSVSSRCSWFFCSPSFSCHYALGGTNISKFLGPPLSLCVYASSVACNVDSDYDYDSIMASHSRTTNIAWEISRVHRALSVRGFVGV